MNCRVSVLRTCGTLLLLACMSQLVFAFDLQAHRGGRGLLPENTLAAFENAIRMGVTTIELDIAVTADGVPVISHDSALKAAITRDADGNWLAARGPYINTLTLAQLQTYDVGRIDPASTYARDFPDQQPRDGQHIPTLASLFKLVNDLGAHDVHFDMETKIDPNEPANTLKPRTFVDAVLKAIRDAGLTKRVMVQSFDWRTLELIHKSEPRLRTMYLTIESAGFHTLKDGSWTAGHLLKNHRGSVARMVRASARKSKGVIWAPNFKNLTLPKLREAKQLGLRVIPWTVNSKPDMERLIEWGVDGIITDYPNRLRDVMRDMAMVLPKSVSN